MEHLSAAQGADRTTAVVLGASTVAYMLYHYGLTSSAWLSRWLQKQPWSEVMQARAVLWQRFLGGLLLGTLPLLAVLAWTDLGLSDLGLGLPAPGGAVGGALALLVVALPSVILSARREGAGRDYPEIRAVRFWPGLAEKNGASWIVYLLGYEILFRGVLLFGLAHSLGVWAAISVTTALYVAVHLGKNARECVATLPMGVLFALVALAAGGFWPSFAVHTVVAITNDTLVQRQRSRPA